MGVVVVGEVSHCVSRVCHVVIGKIEPVISIGLGEFHPSLCGGRNGIAAASPSVLGKGGPVLVPGCGQDKLERAGSVSIVCLVR